MHDIIPTTSLSQFLSNLWDLLNQAWGQAFGPSWGEVRCPAVPGYNRQAGLPDACPIHKAWIPSWRNAGTEPGLETPDIGSLAQYVLLHLGCYPHLGRLKVCMPRKEMHKFQGTTLNSKLSIRYQEVYGFLQVISSHRSKFCIDHSWLYSI